MTTYARAERRLTLVSNRGAVEHWLDESGEVRRRKSGGGVATALADVATSVPVNWIAGAATVTDQLLAQTKTPLDIGHRSTLRFVDAPEDARRLHYELFCNPLLWFLQHGLADELERPFLASEMLHGWENGYVPVNRCFADAVLEQLEADPQLLDVMLHDYHLYLVAAMVRRTRPDVSFQLFLHIPWPDPSAWEVLPRAVTASICQGLLCNDSIVFQTDESVENFFATCACYLGSKVKAFVRDREVLFQGRRTAVWSNPISVDVDRLAGDVASPEARLYQSEIKRETAEKTIVRVDRLDPSKNVAAGFEAFACLLADHPEWLGRVKFLAFLTPSRSGIAEYRGYSARVLRLVEDINGRFGSNSWTPIKVYLENNRIQALAAMTLYDVLLVNSRADGMNLVSKEGPAVNQRNGVLVLSTSVGSFAELRCGAIGVEPQNVADTSVGLHEALSMGVVERRQRAELLRQAVSSHQLSDWLNLQLADMRTIGDFKRLGREAVEDDVRWPRKQRFPACGLGTVSKP